MTLPSERGLVSEAPCLRIVETLLARVVYPHITKAPGVARGIVVVAHPSTVLCALRPVENQAGSGCLFPATVC